MNFFIGEKGVAYTLITHNEFNFAAELVRNLEGANQIVPQELIDLAMKVIISFLFHLLLLESQI